MSQAYKSKEVLLGGAEQTVGANATNTAISEVFGPSYLDALNMVASVKVSAIVVAAGVAFNVQASADGTNGWTDCKAADVSLTTTGWAHCRLNIETAADVAQLPLLPFLRVVVTTGAGDSVTFTDVRVSNRG